MWRAFGDCPNYVEPFFGSGAVMLGRPHEPKIETANDADTYVANFWRATTAAPEEVAEWADWPVNEVDLHARHKWLVSRTEFRERLRADPDYFDAKVAGWWVWGICQWIGSGWCVEPNNHKHPKLDGIGKGVHSDEANGARLTHGLPYLRVNPMGNQAGVGVHAEGVLNRAKKERHRNADSEQRPALSTSGMGVHARGKRNCEADHRKRPSMDGTSQGLGVHSDAGHRKIPNMVPTGIHGAGHVGDEHRPEHQSRQIPVLKAQAGFGIHADQAFRDRGLPALGNDRGLNGVSAPPCQEWFRALRARLRRVRFACGDFQRVLGPSVLGKGKNVGGRKPCAVFLDPPYSHEFREPFLYTEDDKAVAEKAREWAIEHGDDPELRIALCGYWDEHREVMPANWTAHRWKGARGYAGDDNDNRDQETIWFSPHCLAIDEQTSLFGAAQ